MRKSRIFVYATSLFILIGINCSDQKSDQPVLRADLPLHLEEHLDDARIEESEVPKDLLAPVEWNFDEPQPDWKPLLSTVDPTIKPRTEQSDGVLRVRLDQSNQMLGGQTLRGAVYVDLPDWRREDWDHLLIRARATAGLQYISVAYNVGSRTIPGRDELIPFHFTGQGTSVFADGAIHTYRLQADRSPAFWGEWKDPWRQLILMFMASEPSTIDILSVTAVSKAAHYGDLPAGIRTQERGGAVRRALYMHAPGSLIYQIAVPPNARLDFGLGVLSASDPVTFKVKAALPGIDQEPLFEEKYADKESWAQRSVDLAHLAGKTVNLILETESDLEGSVALWSAPTLSGSRRTNRPNVILYVVDGLGAEYMSLYGFNLNTTPYLERIAAEGVVFEQAFSNARWTTPSTKTLMTSLFHSVLGGFQGERAQLPERVVTMAQHFHRARYQTAVLTGNTYATRVADLGKEVDVLRDAYLGSASSITLQDEFWRWREAFPGQPYWIHFQTTDVWGPGQQDFLGPFDGLYLRSERRKEYQDWSATLRKQYPGHWWRPTPEAFEEADIDRIAYYEAEQMLYAEAVAHQDNQIGRFVEQLKAAGEWENTIFIVTADHGQHEAGLVMVDPPIPDGQHTNLRLEQTRIPLLFVWPGHIPGGLRFRHPVSLLDVLPTILDLVGLPPAEVAQGRSLAPLLLGDIQESEWEPRPVILDEFYMDPESGNLRGWIEVVDGRWGASLEINPPVQPRWANRGEYDDAQGERPAPLLLYDLWYDPYCLSPVNEERPELVEKYTNLLKDQFAAHLTLAKHVGTPGKEVELTPEQLETLRSLGYIR